jgi:hypothetical protein
MNKPFPGLAAFDRGNPDRIFASKDVSDGGKMEIYEVTRVSASSFTTVRKTWSRVDQWRPVTTNAPDYNVFWLNKNKYDAYYSSPPGTHAFIMQLVCKTL